jgi:transposase
MQGEERMDRQLLDAEMLAGHLVPAGSMFAFLAAHRAEIFPDEDFADLFPSGRGRPSIPATVMAAVIALQTLHDYSDRETAEAVCFDVRWKVACGLAVDDPGFDPSTLVYWRRRLAKSSRPHRVNDMVKKIVEETGVLKGRRRRAVDSTILADGVATQDTITQLVSAIRRVAREVPGAAEQIAAVCTGHDYSQPGKPKIDWDDPAAKDALVSVLVNDASALVEALEHAELDEGAAAALALLALVAGQDVEPAEGSDGRDGRWQIARKVAEDRVISTVDPDARHTRKSPEARRDGYRAHVAADPGTGIITDEQLTRAAGQENSDPAVAEEFLARAAAVQDTNGTGTGPDAAGHQDGDQLAWYGDSAYGTGDLRGAIGDAGHQAVIKPKPLRAPVEGGFTVDDFTVSEEQGTVACPAGHTVRLSQTRIATFGALCRDCPLRQRCTTSKTGRKLVLHERDDLLRAARADWAACSGLREDYMKHRPNVERTVAQVATWRGRRLKLRYRGTVKNNAWLKRRTAVLNLRNLTGKGLARQGGAWVLAT